MTTTFTLYWISANKQSDLNMGSFGTRAEAEAAIPAARAELIDQCGEDDEIARINAGTIEIAEEIAD